VATSNVVLHNRLTPVFVDVDPLTYNIDPALIEAKVTPKTRAIIPVHLYGQPADMDPILAVARKHALRVIGDGAQAHGALYKGRPIATLADITCYSFYPGKNLGAYGDGGALVTNNPEWAVAARMFANHGRTKKYDHDLEGVNSRLDGLQAAILSVKLRHIEAWTESRRLNARRYTAALAGRKLVTPVELPDVRAVYHLYVVRVPAEQREALQAFLKEAGIDTGVHYPIALPLLKAYSYLGHTPEDFPVASRMMREIVSLPMFPELTEAQIERVSDALHGA
jgi:dTDP-4-amino-4,6-dideoxygalactose transaminase